MPRMLMQSTLQKCVKDFWQRHERSWRRTCMLQKRWLRRVGNRNRNVDYPHKGETRGGWWVSGGHIWSANTTWLSSSWCCLCLSWVSCLLLRPRTAGFGKNPLHQQSILMFGRWRRGWNMLRPQKHSLLPGCFTRWKNLLMANFEYLKLFTRFAQPGQKCVHIMVCSDPNLPQGCHWISAPGGRRSLFLVVNIIFHNMLLAKHFFLALNVSGGSLGTQLGHVPGPPTGHPWILIQVDASKYSSYNQS